MPVEIKELVIRAVVANGATDANEEDTAGAAVAAISPPHTAATEDIVQECVRQVLRILAKEKER